MQSLVEFAHDNKKLTLHCKSESRGWPHAQTGGRRPKILRMVYYLIKLAHGPKFEKNPRNGPINWLRTLGKLSVKILLEINLQSNIFLVKNSQ